MQEHVHVHVYTCMRHVYNNFNTCTCTCLHVVNTNLPMKLQPLLSFYLIFYFFNQGSEFSLLSMFITDGMDVILQNTTNISSNYHSE